ncbi:MAG TPA: ankyrin repeat domain-containing protein [Blastocatellia bacterium]|nr:ankyrin repeat domain-containing protein [Blastocatellia bacterium]
MNLTKLLATALLATLLTSSCANRQKADTPLSPQSAPTETPTPDIGPLPDTRLSPLVVAVANGDLSQVQSLVAAGARLNDQTGAGATPLITAAGLGHIDIARFLIEKGADVNEKSPSGFTALMSAALNGHSAMVKLLLDSGAAPKASDSSGRTAMKLAAPGKNHQEIVDLLRKAGASS